MTWQTALRQRLLDDGAVTGLCGTGEKDGQPSIDWTVRRDGARLPALTLRKVFDSFPQHLQGLQARRASRVQVDARGASAAEAAALAEAALACLLPAGDFHGVRFGRAIVEEPGVHSLPEQNDAGFVHRDIFDLTVWHD